MSDKKTKERVVTVRITEDQYHNGVSQQAYYAALGYLSMWGAGHSKTTYCRITGQPDDMLTACYSQTENGSANFVIGAVWRKDDNEYSFHS